MSSTPNRSLAKNLSLLVGFQFLTKALSAVWTFYIARALGTVGYGLWANVFALAAILSTLQDMGASLFFIRDVSREPERTPELYGAALSLYALSGAGFVAVTMAVGWALRYSPLQMELLALAALSFFALVPSIASQSVLYGREDFVPFILGSFLGTVVYLGAGLLLLKAGAGVAGVLAGMVAGNAANSLWVVRSTIARYGRPKLAWRPRIWKAYLGMGLPILLSSLVYEASFRSDRLLLEKFLGVAAVGLFQAAATLVFLWRDLLQIPVINSVYPRLSAYYSGDRADFKSLFERTTTLFLAVLLPICTLGTVVARDLVRLFFGPAYAPAGGVLAILLWMMPGMFVAALWVHVFVLQERQNAVFWTKSFALASSLGFNFALLPRLGLVGSAWAAVAAQSLNWALIAALLRQEDIFGFAAKLPRLALAAAACAITGLALRRGREGFLGALVLPGSAGLAVYAYLLLRLEVFRKEDLDELRRRLGTFQTAVRNALRLGSGPEGGLRP